jgi:hypothetical protein
VVSNGSRVGQNFMNWPSVKPATIAISTLMALCASLLIFFDLYTGLWSNLCLKTGVRLTDSEAQRLALNHFMTLFPSVTEIELDHLQMREVSYHSLLDFLEKNPHCCRVYDEEIGGYLVVVQYRSKMASRPEINERPIVKTETSSNSVVWIRVERCGSAYQVD